MADCTSVEVMRQLLGSVEVSLAGVPLEVGEVKCLELLGNEG